MLVLFETPAGIALFKLLDESKLDDPDLLFSKFESIQEAVKVVSLKQFSKFEDTTEALASATALVEGKVTASLTKFLRKEVGKGEKLAVAESKLGVAIKEALGIECLANSQINELMRCLRYRMMDLLGDNLLPKEMNQMALGLAHSLGRYKLKFSPDKVDTMIVQAISLLDDLDKELNIYSMRVKEWYGWHFPEMTKVIVDNIQYSKVVKLMGVRTNAANTNFSELGMEESVLQDLLHAAQISMGTEITKTDIDHIKDLCNQIIEISEYKDTLLKYLKNRMRAIAPNLSIIVGEVIGARLIARAGNLMNLAKHPASTIQLLGAEKALFRALKTKQQTPKYGLLFHAQLVGSAPAKFKGKISRVLANKTALSIRVDALGDSSTKQIGTEGLEKVQARLRQLELGQMHQISGRGSQTEQSKYKRHEQASHSYDEHADTTIGENTFNQERKRKRQSKGEPETHQKPGKHENKKRRKEKEVPVKDEAQVQVQSDGQEKAERKSKDKGKHEAKVKPERKSKEQEKPVGKSKNQEKHEAKVKPERKSKEQEKPESESEDDESMSE